MSQEQKVEKILSHWKKRWLKSTQEELINELVSLHTGNEGALHRYCEGEINSEYEIAIEKERANE